MPHRDVHGNRLGIDLGMGFPMTETKWHSLGKQSGFFDCILQFQIMQQVSQILQSVAFPACSVPRRTVRSSRAVASLGVLLTRHHSSINLRIFGGETMIHALLRPRPIIRLLTNPIFLITQFLLGAAEGRYVRTISSQL